MLAGEFYGPLDRIGRVKCPLDHIALGEWEIRQDPKSPFFYRAANGILLIPNHGMFTDLGTIPRIFWPLLPKSEFAGPYACHDYCCFYGYGWRPVSGGLGEPELACISKAVFIEDEAERKRALYEFFQLETISRKAGDLLLREMVYAWSGGGAFFRRDLVYLGVRFGGFWVWVRKRSKRRMYLWNRL